MYLISFDRWWISTKKLLKIIGYSFLALCVISVWASFKYGKIEEEPTTSPSTNTVAPTEQPKEESKPTPEVKQVEKKNIAVTSQIVKKIGSKCRYFFDIRNNDNSDFEGSVEISLQKPSGTTLGRETFNTNKPIEPTLGSSVNFDINTCPSSQAGEYGISNFAYKVFAGKDVVAEGNGAISNKYEDLN